MARRTKPRRESDPVEGLEVVGRNAVLEALKAGCRIDEVLVAQGQSDPRLDQISGMARARGVAVTVLPRDEFRDRVRLAAHQGVFARVARFEYQGLDAALDAAKQSGRFARIALLDHLEDPQNLGAIIRSADSAGVHGVVLPRRRSAQVNATVAKASAGALFHVPIVRVANLATTMEVLRKEGFWLVGADADGQHEMTDIPVDAHLGLVVGGEGRGLHRLVRERCDFVVRIPMWGKVSSLNVSVASSLLFYAAPPREVGRMD